MHLETDLFEYLRRAVGCNYISDLRFEPFNHQAKSMISNLELEDYPLRTLEDLAEYLFYHKEQFDDACQAQRFFQHQAMEQRARA